MRPVSLQIQKVEIVAFLRLASGSETAILFFETAGFKRSPTPAFLFYAETITCGKYAAQQRVLRDETSACPY
jgi:hypothetical protein